MSDTIDAVEADRALKAKHRAMWPPATTRRWPPT